MRGTGWTARDTSGAGNDLKGNQINLTVGLGRKLNADTLVGVVAGYEHFKYDVASLNGTLKGDGETIGGYFSRRFAGNLRFDAALAWSTVNYNASSGTASGSFKGSRWLAVTGLTGNYKAGVYMLEPSAKLYMLWESQNAWTDSLGTAQAVGIEIYTTTGVLKAQEPWGDIQRISYGLRNSVDAGNTSQDLYRGVCRNLLSISTPEVEDQLLLRDVSRIDFECFDGTQWTPNWDTTDTSSVNTNLPIAVRVRIQLGKPGAVRADAIEMLVPIDSQSRTNSTSTAGG